MHAALLLVWGGMVSFGAAMDAEHNGSGRNTYKVVALTGSMLGSAHVAWCTGVLARSLLVRRWHFLILYAAVIRRAVCFAVFSALAFACIRITNAMSDSPARPAITRSFDCFLILNTCFLVLQTTAVGLFTYVFFAHRMITWRQIESNDASILGHPGITRAFTCACVCAGITEHTPLREFLDRWIGVSDSEILSSLPQQANGLYASLLSLMHPIDADCIQKDEFMRFLAGSRVDASDPSVTRLWKMLSSGREDVGGVTITPSSVERMLYGIAFRRKRFAHQVLTDQTCITRIMWYIALILYPLCAVFIAKMWGYSGAYGEGLDLLKTYVISVSFISAQLRERLLFMITMVVRRPFDIGDILLVNGGAFRIRDFTSSYTHMQGSTALTVRNTVLLGGTIVNLTKGHVKDGVSLSLAITADNDAAHRARDALISYAQANPDVVDPGSVRVGWAGVEGGSVKVLAVNWGYSFVVHDVNRYNMTRTAVANHVVTSLGADASLAGLGWVSAQGGAFNAHTSVLDYYSRM